MKIKRRLSIVALVVAMIMGSGWYLSRHLAFIKGNSIEGYLAWLSEAQMAYAPGQLVLLQNIMGHPWVIKYIAGRPGERITIHGDMIFVDSRKIGRLEKYDSKGRNLLPIKEGVIPEGHYFVVGTHHRSLDSRYQQFGLVPHHKIARRAWLVF